MAVLYWKSCYNEAHYNEVGLYYSTEAPWTHCEPNKHMSCLKNPTICICENKDAHQLHGNCKADQCLCFCYTDRTFPLLLKSEISSF